MDQTDNQTEEAFGATGSWEEELLESTEIPAMSTLVEVILENPKANYAKGGAVMQEGGFKDDGMEVDPRTGNEVPPGSLDQEVSDTVDARLSEGEYVLPADVVRFIGLGQIEALVQQAKKGLAEMEANGRIGGKPVDSEGMPQDEELTPEEIAMLEEALAADQTPEAMGMATGGAVAAINAAYGNTPQTPGVETEEEKPKDDLGFTSRSLMRGDNRQGADRDAVSTGEMPSVADMAAMSADDFNGMIGQHNTAKSVMGSFATGPIGAVMSAVDKAFKNRARKAVEMNPALATETTMDAIDTPFSPGVKAAAKEAIGVAADAAKTGLADTAVGKAVGLGKEKDRSESAREAAGMGESGSEGSDSGKGSEGGKGGSEGGSGGSDGRGNREGRDGMSKGGLVKKRPPNKRKKPYKNKRKYGLGTRP